MGRPARAFFSVDALLHNVSVIKSWAPASCLTAMVKANAYGHGIRSVSKFLSPVVDLLGVASLDEAMILRKAGVNNPVLLAEGVFSRDELAVGMENDCQFVFHGFHQIEWLEELSEDFFLQKGPLTAWLKVDSGMGRLGFPVDQVLEVYRRLEGSGRVRKPLGLMSHFACAEWKNHPLTLQQWNVLDGLQEKIPQAPVSFCNSAGIFNFPDRVRSHKMVRPGIALYGLSPLGEGCGADLGLRPVMKVVSELISIHHRKENAYVGYGARYRCPQDMPVGIVAFGYGDGYPLTAETGTPLWVNGALCPLIGRVSMDMIAVDLRPCPHAKVQDLVVLWGPELPVEKMALHTMSHPWDVVTGVHHRVACQWAESKEHKS